MTARSLIMRPRGRAGRPARQAAAGFTLLEVLIAIVIVAIGLLGVAAMQASTLKTAGGSKYRSSAIALTTDMADRLRANLEGSSGGSRVVNTGYNRPRTALADPAYMTPVPACRAGGCTAIEMAQDDLALWNQRLAASLPSGVGVVCIDSGSGGTPTYDGTAIDPQCDGLGAAFAIKVFWLDNRNETSAGAGNAGAYSVFTTRVSPI
ncbi:MAG: type IV pilus modification protein PilV [Lautropia sp.]